MITEEDVLCNDYKEKVHMSYRGGEASRGTYVCLNPDCRCDKFYRHGSYEKWVVPLAFLDDILSCPPEWLEDSLAGAFRLKVLRVICTGCGRTDAILPADAVPYHIFSVLFILKLVKMLLEDIPPQEKPVLHQQPGLSWHVLQAVVTAFRQYEAKMIAAIRLSGLYMKSDQPSSQELLSIYAKGHPPSEACRAFLQCFRKPLFVTRHSTVSSPMRFILKKPSEYPST